MPELSILRGHLLDAGKTEPVSIPDGVLVMENGSIKAKGTATDIGKSHPGLPLPNRNDAGYPVILPGLVDIHAHLPQYPAVARPEESLLPWLKRHIFPLESGFRGAETASVIEAFFDEQLACGTTTIVLYGAIWEDTCDLAFQIAERRGLRLVLGKVMMDDGTYGDLPADEALDLSLEQTDRLAEKWHGANNGLLEYAVSPRFAVTCSREMMEGAARLAKKHDCFIQTHLSENHGEIQAVAQRFPWAKDYTDVYDQCGLLGNKTILGHGIHLSDREIDTLSARGSILAHCPTSNLFLNSGLLPMDRLRSAGVRTCLASDVAGGPELNMWQVMRSAIEIQKARRFTDPDVPELTPTEAFRQCTSEAGAALQHPTGTLDVGSDADLTVFDLDAVLPYGGKLTDKASLTAEDLLALLVYRGQPVACTAAYVAGNKVTPE